MVDITLVVPAYNEEEVLEIFYNETSKVVSKELSDVSYEYLFIDDGSSDQTMKVIKSLVERDEKVKFVSFSRNFGKEAAIYAGLKYANGKNVVVMDADLQDPPTLLPEMYHLIQSGEYDCVGTRRVTRAGEPPIRSFFAKLFYKIMGKISKTEVVDGARDFQMMNRKVVDAILSMGEYNRFSKGIIGWVGYKKKWLEYENVERAAGETKWSFWKLFIYAIEGITAFSTAPLVLASVMGVVMCIAAFLAIIFIIVRTAIYGDPTSGWPSMVCIIMLVSGVQLLSIGVLGQYISKIYLETKRRPIFLVGETNTKRLDEE